MPGIRSGMCRRMWWFRGSALARLAPQPPKTATALARPPQPPTTAPHGPHRHRPGAARRHRPRPRADRRARHQPPGLAQGLGRPVRDLAPDQPLTERAIDDLRGVQGLNVELATADARTVAGLAMAGIPLRATGSNPHLSEALTNALNNQPDLDDPLAREQHSVTTRRAALDTHSTLAWRRDLADTGGRPVRRAAEGQRPARHDASAPARLRDAPARPPAGRRAAGRPRHPRLGRFTEDEVRARLHGHDVVVRKHDQDAFFGDVLNDAATVADGDVLLKVDDDDWYSPHAIHDLLLARRYTGAEVVGMPSEFVYLEELGVTARRNHPTEIHNRFVAGGTIMIERQLLRSLGGFRRVRRFVDAQLLNAVEASGARIYRTHGLGYILRRTASRPHLAVRPRVLPQARDPRARVAGLPRPARVRDRGGGPSHEPAPDPPQRVARAERADARRLDPDQERQRRHPDLERRRDLALRARRPGRADATPRISSR